MLFDFKQKMSLFLLIFATFVLKANANSNMAQWEINDAPYRSRGRDYSIMSEFNKNSSGSTSHAEAIVEPKKNKPTVTQKFVPVRKKKQKKGSFTLNFGRHSSHAEFNNIYPPIDDQRVFSGLQRINSPITISRKNKNARILPRDKTNISKQYSSNTEEQFTLTIDGSSAGRLFFVLLGASAAIMNAFMGTLRLLGPLIVSRKVLVEIGNFLTDYLRGRYLRTTYTRLEKMFLRYYELPAASRAFARATSHICFLLFLSKIMGWMVGVGKTPCRSDGRGLAFFCGLLWVGAVLGTGDAFSAAVSVWGGPLRIQASIDPISSRSRRARLKDTFSNPFNILQFMQEPGRWIKIISTRSVKAFNPNPVLFPVTWRFFRVLQVFVLAFILSTEPCDYSWGANGADRIPRIMRAFLIQSGLRDEWLLVFFRERRVGLGINAIALYFIALAAFIVECAKTNLKVTALFLPNVLALVISGWMNIVIFWNRLDEKDKVAILNAVPFTQKKEANSLSNAPPPLLY